MEAQNIFMKKYIAYYRVSTKEQGNSGLGLEAQINIVERFIQSEKNRTTTLKNPNGENMCLFAEFMDIETGTGSGYLMKGLNNAIASCKSLMSKNDETILLIAKLDRLSRNLHFITSLQEAKIKFICCDMPNADNTTIHIFGSIAQREAEMIRTRTKDSLAVFKERNKDGFIDSKGNFRLNIGNPQNLTNEARIKGGLVNRQKGLVNENNIRAASYGKVLYNSGMTYAAIAQKLNEDGFTTANGYKFTGMQIQRLVKPLLENGSRPIGRYPKK